MTQGLHYHAPLYKGVLRKDVCGAYCAWIISLVALWAFAFTESRQVQIKQLWS